MVKRQPPERIKAAYALGVRDFAHSYVQEALDQQDLWAHMPEARWHFIGRIQSNKTRHLCEGWHRIHSVDRLKTARRLGSASALVQVRLGGEHSKAGVDPAELREAIERIAAETSVQIRGLMALPPPRDRWGDLRPLRRSLGCATSSKRRTILCQTPESSAWEPAAITWRHSAQAPPGSGSARRCSEPVKRPPSSRQRCRLKKEDQPRQSTGLKRLNGWDPHPNRLI